MAALAAARTPAKLLVSISRAPKHTGATGEPAGSYDAVVVGGGHNGLVCAAYLQRAGLRACVLERRHVVGGAAVTEEIVPGYKFSRASYVLSLLRPQIIADLELKRHGLKVYRRDPSSYTPLRGERSSLLLGSDGQQNAQQIARFSHKDAQAYHVYEKQLSRLVTFLNAVLEVAPADVSAALEAPRLWQKIAVVTRSPQLRAAASSMLRLGSDLVPLWEFMTAPTTKILARWFESEPLKATLATDAVIGSMSSPDLPGTGYVLLHHLMGELDGVPGAWGYPEGGMGSVTQALARAALSAGAHIFTDTAVAEIKCDVSGRAVGVVTSEGREVKGDVVLSNATPKVTFLDLLPAGLLPEAFQETVERIDYTSPVTKINVAVDRLPNFSADPCVTAGEAMPHHQCTIHLNCENTELITQAYGEAQHGRLCDRPMIEMVIPSSLDPTLAPPGHHVCLLFTQYTPYQLADGGVWDEPTKEKYADMVFDNVEEYAPGFKASIVGKEVLSPPDLERIFGLTGGNIFHGAISTDQLFLNRVTPAAPFTPVPRLLLCGSGIHPGGGVMGAPGLIAARASLRLLGSRRRIP